MAQFKKFAAPDAKDKLEGALKLNRQMQLQLLMVKDKIEKLLKNVQEIYKSNENIMRNHMQTQRRKGIGIRGAYLKGGTFYLKGNMFFKDFDCRNCPDNSDYKRRKANNEMFPMDLELKGRHVWSINDKKNLVEGIKEQIIERLRDSGQDAAYESKELDSEKLVKLLEMVQSDFHIDWQTISQYNLQHRHSAQSCEAIWNVYLNPSLKRSKWTEAENQKLLKIAKKYKCENWQAIAKDIGSRSDFQCFVQYRNYVCFMTSEKCNRWNKEEDARLIEVIERNTMNGIINWSIVMSHFPHRPRTTLQCRYSYSLCPNINHAPFTPEEDLLLLASVKEYGTKFHCFPRTLFPNRTTVQLRSRYNNTLMHRHKLKSWTLEDDAKLLEFVTQNGNKSWKKCADYVETHTRISCRTRYGVIEKYFKKNPNRSLADLPRQKQKVWSYVNTQNWTEKLMELAENPNAQLVKKVRAQPIIRKKEPKIKTEEAKKVKKEPKRKRTRPTANAERRKAVFIQRLRTNSLKMYHSFKYAYNAELGYDPIGNLTTANCSKLGFVKEALKLQPHSGNVKNYQFDGNIPKKSRRKIHKVMKDNTTYQLPDGFSLPASWSTAMAFRALCIHSARTDLQTVIEPELDDSNVYIEIFRQRLRTLFYTTALLSRIHPLMVGMGQQSQQPKEENIDKKRTNDIDIDPASSPEQIKKKPKIIHKSVIEQVLSIKQEKTGNVEI